SDSVPERNKLTTRVADSLITGASGVVRSAVKIRLADSLVERASVAVRFMPAEPPNRLMFQTSTWLLPSLQCLLSIHDKPSFSQAGRDVSSNAPEPVFL